MFFATPEDAEKLAAQSGYDFGAIESIADFAFALSEHSYPRCPDGELCKAEVSLGVQMIKWAMRKARGDFATESEEQQKSLKLIVGQYENLWLERAAVGGLAESSRKIRQLSDVF